MDNYIKTIINGLKAWVTSGLNRLEASVTKLSGNLDTQGSKVTNNAKNIAQLQKYENETHGIATEAKSAADTAQTTANEAKSAVDGKANLDSPKFTDKITIGGADYGKIETNRTTVDGAAKLTLSHTKTGTDNHKVCLDSDGYLTLDNIDALKLSIFATDENFAKRIQGVATPVNTLDAANKAYVDSAVADTISETRVNELIDEKLGVIENGSY